MQDSSTVISVLLYAGHGVFRTKYPSSFLMIIFFPPQAGTNGVHIVPSHRLKFWEERQRRGLG